MRSFGSFAGFADFLGGLGARLGVGYHGALEEGAKVVEAEAKRVLGTYDYGWPSLKPETIGHKKTGDSPLLETGKMRNAIKHEVGWMHARVFCDDPKAAFHELGTSKMAPRPFLGPAAAAKEKEVAHIIGRRVVGLLSGDSVTIAGKPNP